jgi:hypothetical protein
MCDAMMLQLCVFFYRWCEVEQGRAGHSHSAEVVVAAVAAHGAHNMPGMPALLRTLCQVNILRCHAVQSCV